MAKLDHNIRLLIYRFHIVFGYDSRTIFNLLVGDSDFNLVPLKLSLNYLVQLCRKLNFPEFAEWYLLGPYPSMAGRKPCTNDDERYFIIQTIKFQKTIHLKELRRIFHHSYRGIFNLQNLPSISTIFRVLKAGKISLKKISRRHIRFDEAEALTFFRNVSHIPTQDLIFLDEASSSPDSFLMKYGWAPSGEDCLIDQIVIGNRSFSLIIAVSLAGIVAWHLIEGTNSEVEFQNFLTSLRTRLFPENFLILDNASIHRTENSQTMLEEISNGQFFYGPRYAPHLMPHEKVFSLIKPEIRERENQALLFPVQTITEVVQLFEIGGPRSNSIRNFWNQYVINHNHFLSL